MLNRKALAAVLTILGLAALCLASTGWATMPSIVAAAVLLFLAASLLSKARTLALSVRELVGRSVVVAAWGTPLPANGPQLVLAAASSFGAGLLIRLQAGGRTELLKVAQPQCGSFEGDSLVVPEAAYVQWAGKRLPRKAGQHAVVLRAAA